MFSSEQPSLTKVMAREPDEWWWDHKTNDVFGFERTWMSENMPGCKYEIEDYDKTSGGITFLFYNDEDACVFKLKYLYG